MQRKIIDCFLFYNELDLLFYRLSILYDVVDKFILVESTKTFAGNDKELYYQNNKDMFKKFSDKIIHIIVDELQSNPNIENQEQWNNEYIQRNHIEDGIQQISHTLDNTDLLLINDVDEIPNRDVLYTLKNNSDIKFNIIALEQYHFNYNLKTMVNTYWYAPVLVSYEFYSRDRHPQNYRNNLATLPEFIKNGGWHLSYMIVEGNENIMSNKIKNYSHQEYNSDKYTNEDNIKYCIKNRIDIFERNYCQLIPTPNSSFLPTDYDKYLQKYL